MVWNHRTGALAPLALSLVLPLALLATAACGTMNDDEDEGGAGGERVEITGCLTDEGVECQALRSDDGTLYTLTGDLGGAATGQRVTVTGTVAEVSFCQQGTTIGVESLRVVGTCTGGEGTAEVPAGTGGGEPRVVAETNGAAPGEPVTVRAAGFPPRTEVEIGAGPVESEYEVLERVTTDAAGRAEVEVRLPDWADPRQRWVFVAAAADHRLKAVSGEFPVENRRE